MYRYCLISILFIFCANQNISAQSQDSVSNPSIDSSAYVVINSIELIGNKRTRPWIITRELDIKQGDTIFLYALGPTMELERNKIFNTKLFNVVDFNQNIQEGRLDLKIIMEERWYLWPTVDVDLGDRNFNEWLLQRGARVERLVYGVSFRDRNFRGRKENLKLKLQLGFTRKTEIFYDIPFVDKNQKTGLGFKVSYSDNNVVAYEVNDHQLQFVDSDQIERRRFYANAYVVRRSQFFGSHLLGADYHQQWVGDTIIGLNPNYFGDGQNLSQFFVLKYNYSWDRRNIAFYPTEGYYIQFQLSKLGLGIFNDLDMWVGNIAAAKFFNLGKGFYTNHYTSVKISGPDRQPYFQYEGLGFGRNLLRGFDLYVINGNYFAVNKNEFKYRLLSFRRTFDWFPVPQFRTIPIDIFVKAFSDFGYVEDLNTRILNQRFSNKLLSGYGVGMDIATFYDLVFRIEYSINQDAETNVFVNVQAAF